MSREKVMNAVPEDAWNRLTRNGDDGLARDLYEVVVAMWVDGYQEGVRRGAELLRDAVVARSSKAETP